MQNWFRSSAKNHPITRDRKSVSKHRRRFRLGIEVLEDRTVPTVLTFEGQAPDFVSTLTTFGGLTWSGLNALNNSPTLNGLDGGYNNGAVSGTTVAYVPSDTAEPGVITSLTPFTFNSAYLTAAYNDNLNVVVEGRRDGQLLYTTSLTLGPRARRSATSTTLGSTTCASIRQAERRRPTSDTAPATTSLSIT